MSMASQLYEPHDSYLYRLDPRTKIIGMLVAFAISIIFSHPLFLGGLFFIIILVIISGGVPIRRVMILLKGLAALAMISIIMWPMFYKQGTPLFSFWIFRFTREGLAFGFGMAFRILSMVLASITLMMITPQRDLILGLRGLGLPYKASFAVATALRFLPMMVGVGQTIREAQRSRGQDLEKGNIIERMKANSAILAPLIIESIRLSQQLVLAVEARGFGRTNERTSLVALKYSSTDIAVLWVLGGLLVTAVALRFFGLGYMPT
jgi:energy-coupling factor transport system permease protein